MGMVTRNGARSSMKRTVGDGRECVTVSGSCIDDSYEEMNVLSESDNSSLNVIGEGYCRFDNNL